LLLSKCPNVLLNIDNTFQCTYDAAKQQTQKSTNIFFIFSPMFGQCIKQSQKKENKGLKIGMVTVL